MDKPSNRPISRFAELAAENCIAVIFSNQLTNQAEPPSIQSGIFPTNSPVDGAKISYEAMADRMAELARQQDGFLGIESTRDPSGFGITVSYWKDMESVTKWRADFDHEIAQKLGKEKWYEKYRIRVCKLEYQLEFSNEVGNSQGERI